MINEIFWNPTKVFFGKGTEAEVGKEVASMAKKVLLHYGGQSIKKFGLYDKIVASLQEAGVDFVELGGVQPNPRASLIEKGIELCKKENIDFILAVGGGSVIDSAKGIAAGVCYDGPLLDLFTGKADVEDILPIGVVLTIPGAGSESSTGCVVTFEEEGLKRSFDSNLARPKFAILNPEVTFTLPEFQSMCGVVDAICHVHERYFTNTTFVDCTDRICEGIIKTLMKYGPMLKDHPHDYDIRAEVMWACKVAHDGTDGVGREEDWATHNIEHEVSAQYDVTHAAGLACISPAWMKYCFKTNVPRFMQYANRVYDIPIEGRDEDEVFAELIEKYTAFLKTMSMPTTLRELGINEKTHFAEMADKCVRYTGGTTGNFKKLDAKDVEAILELAF